MARVPYPHFAKKSLDMIENNGLSPPEPREKWQKRPQRIDSKEDELIR
jgi:hypothetical protein